MLQVYVKRARWDARAIARAYTPCKNTGGPESRAGRTGTYAVIALDCETAVRSYTDSGTALSDA